MVVKPDSPQRIARLTPLSDVLAHLDGLVRPVPPRTSDLSGALGSTLAEDVVANAPVPATARALRDGWAVRADHTTDAGTYAPAPLPAAARIDVGQPLAGDADAVTPFDALTVRNGMAQALVPVGPGDGVLSAGADVAAGAVLMEAGRRLARPQIEVLAAAGVAAVRIRAPRLRLVRVGQSGDAFIDAAFACVADAIGARGGVAVTTGPAGLADALADPAVDAIVVVGGTGSGQPECQRTAKLTHKVSSTVGLSELVSVRCEGRFATPIASGYVPLSALAQANGWILIAPESEGYPASTEVMVRPWP